MKITSITIDGVTYSGDDPKLGVIRRAISAAMKLSTDDIVTIRNLLSSAQQLVDGVANEVPYGGSDELIAASDATEEQIAQVNRLLARGY